MSALPQPRQFEFIYGLRSLAALSVLAIHTLDHGLVKFPGWRNTPDPSPLVRVISLGRYGPALFFLASAYILFHSLRERQNSERHPRRNFFLRRAFRILPLWWLFVGMYYYTTRPALDVTAWNLSMLFGFVGYWQKVRISDVQWTLFVEESFYLLLPSIFVYLHSLRRAAIFVFVTVLCRELWLGCGSLVPPPATLGFFDLFPFSHWYSFAIGIFLYHLLELNPRPLSSESRGASIFWAVTVFVAMCGLFVGNIPTYTALGCLVLLFISARSPKTLLGKLCRSRWLRPFGVYCYAIYLFHLTLLGWMFPLQFPILHHLGLDGVKVEIQFLVWFPLMMLLCLAGAWFLYWTLERPLIVLGNRWVERWESAPSRIDPTLCLEVKTGHESY